MNISKLIKKLYFYNRISYLFIRKKKVKSEEYAHDYDIISKTYENLWIKKMGKYTKEMIGEIEFKEGYSLLDLGCGTGFIIKEALAKAAPLKIIGIDHSKKMLEMARSEIKSGRVEFIHGEMISEIKKVPDSSVDIVTCGWALSYVKPNELVKEINRILKVGGQVGIISNRRGCIELVQKSFIKLMECYPNKIKIVNDIQFNLIKNANHLKRIFEKNKLKWINGWDKEQSFSFKKGIDAVSWVKGCGAIAGTFQILSIRDFVKPLSLILEQIYKKDGKIKITHKFSVGVAKKC